MGSSGGMIGDSRFWGRPDRTNYSGLELDGVEFEGCHFPASAAPGRWNVVRDVNARNLTQCNCSADTTWFDNVSLQNLKRTGDAPLFLWGCVFRHVTLAGRISGIKINRSVGPGTDPAIQQAWDKRVIEHYREVDWALDISDAKFAGGVSFGAVPGDKIKFDPLTQILVRRSSLESRDWRSVDFANTAIDLELSWFLSGSMFDSVVLAARTGDRKRVAKDIEVLTLLRTEGIADPA